MREPSFGEKILVLLGIVMSAAGFVWCVTTPDKPPAVFLRLCLNAAGLSCLWLFTLCWATFFAYVVRKIDWSPRACAFVGIPIFVAGVTLVVISSSPHFFFVGDILITQAVFAGFVTRRLAFPELTGEQIAASLAPLSLFPK
jgi:hypothetical protein